MTLHLPEWKFSANLAFFGARRDRFTEYQPARDLNQRLEMASQVRGLTGVELRHPGDFTDPALLRVLLERHNLALSAVNVDIKDARYFRFGSLSARSAEARRRAVELLQQGMDLAADFSAGLVTTCPVMDGYDYPFQLDYTDAWGRMIDSVRQAASHRADVILLVEYQPSEPNAHILLSNVGKVLHLCSEVGLPNLAANLDIGHAIAAGEAPAESAALLAGKGLLRYIHTNDNTGDGGDWDMISGSVHFWHWLELLYTLARLGYTGWMGGDLNPRHIGPGAAYQTNIDLINAMGALLERVGLERLDAVLQEDGQVEALYQAFIQGMAKNT